MSNIKKFRIKSFKNKNVILKLDKLFLKFGKKIILDNLDLELSNGQMDYFARKKLLWDGENMKITNLEEANQFVSREYREGFTV